MIFMNIKKSLFEIDTCRRKTHRKRPSTVRSWLLIAGAVVVVVAGIAATAIVEAAKHTHRETHIASDSDVNHFISVASNECIYSNDFLYWLPVQHIIGYIIRPCLIQFNVILPLLESILSPHIYLIEMQFGFLSLSPSRFALLHADCIGLLTHWLIRQYNWVCFFSLYAWIYDYFLGAFLHNSNIVWHLKWSHVVANCFYFAFWLFFGFSNDFLFDAQMYMRTREKTAAQNDREKTMCLVLCRKGNEVALNVTIVCLPFVLWSHTFGRSLGNLNECYENDGNKTIDGGVSSSDWICYNSYICGVHCAPQYTRL